MLEKLIELLKPNVSIEAKLTGISLFIGKTLDKFQGRIEKLESRQLQKGDKGDNGKDGINGKDGLDGKDGKIGLSGSNGSNGKDGKQGKEGDSVVDSWIAADGNFIFKLSSGKEIDAGNPLEMESIKKLVQINTQLANNQITVSTTAPPSPYLNQLWYDIT